jgi:hypothetical protein
MLGFHFFTEVSKGRQFYRKGSSDASTIGPLIANIPIKHSERPRFVPFLAIGNEGAASD